MTLTELSPEHAALGKKCWVMLETLHTTAYFAPEPTAAYKALGLRGRDGYFASRVAPMGAVPPEVCVATFYVFAPVLVHAALPAAWQTAGVEQVLGARHAGVAATLHGALGDPDVTEALELARLATTGLTPQGRALYAGHAALPWPEDPLLALWHAASLLREHRGDGHVAALVQAGLDPVEAIITWGTAVGALDFMKLTRGWTEQEWAAGEERLRARGVLDGAGALTEEGLALRARVEAQTDAAALEGWAALGEPGCARLLELLRPLRQQLMDSDVFPEWYPGRRR